MWTSLNKPGLLRCLDLNDNTGVVVGVLEKTLEGCQIGLVV